jgi:hypothetical protein
MGSVRFLLRRYMKSVYIDLVLDYNTTTRSRGGSTSTIQRLHSPPGLGMPQAGTQVVQPAYVAGD